MKKLYAMLLLAATLTGRAAADDAVPAPDMQGMELTAQQWNQQIYAGWNLGNSLESAPSGWDANSTNIGWTKAYDTSGETGWGNPKTTQAMIAAVKAAGFNAIRIPVRWGCHITDVSTMTISEAWLKRVREVVDYCIQNDLYVIINTHHDMWLEYQATTSKRDDNNKKLRMLWTQIANYFADYDGRLAFAGTNEVHLKDNWGEPAAANLAVQNIYLQTFVDAVRATGGKNYYRHLIVQTYACNPYFGLGGKLIIPQDVAEHGYSRMSIEYHYYNPYSYCSGQKGSGYYNYWGTNCPTQQKAAVAPENEKSMTDFFAQVDGEWVSKGLGIVIGEWGISDRYSSSLDKKAIHDNMTYYCQFFITEARKRGYSTFVWDNNSFGNGTEKFGVLDRSKNMAVTATWIMDGIKAGVEAAIEQVTPDAEAAAGPTYDLQGHAVEALQPGRVYISRGQKVMVK